MMLEPTRPNVLRSMDSFREIVRHHARATLNAYGVVWRDIDIDEIGIAAAQALDLYGRLCTKLGLVELGDVIPPPQTQRVQSSMEGKS